MTCFHSPICPPSAICTFRNSTYTISRFLRSVICQVTRIPHGSCCPAIWLASSWQRKRQSGRPPPPPTGARSSSTQDGAPTLSPIFMRQGPPWLKGPRSNTITSLPHIDERYLRNAPPSAYFVYLFHKINQDQEIGATTANQENVVMIKMIYQIHKDYRTAINALSEQIKALTEEVSTFKNATTPRPDTHTLIPFPLPVTRVRYGADGAPKKRGPPALVPPPPRPVTNTTGDSP